MATEKAVFFTYLSAIFLIRLFFCRYIVLSVQPFHSAYYRRKDTFVQIIVFRRCEGGGHPSRCQR